MPNNKIIKNCKQIKLLKDKLGNISTELYEESLSQKKLMWK